MQYEFYSDVEIARDFRKLNVKALAPKKLAEANKHLKKMKSLPK